MDLYDQIQSAKTRWFSRDLEHQLPLRYTARSYLQDGGVVSLSDESPETDINERTSGEMYAMSMQVPICGHATVVLKDENSGDARIKVCEPMYAHVNVSHIPLGIDSVIEPGLKWITRCKNPTWMSPIDPPNQPMYFSSIPYSTNGPLMAYTNVASIEAANHSGDSNFWRNLYKPTEMIDCHYTLPGLMYDNTVVSMGDFSGSDENPQIELRSPLPHQRGFISSCFTPPSKGAGRVRLLSWSCVPRVRTKRTIELANRILSSVSPRVGTGFGNWVLRWMGFTTMVTKEDVIAMVNTYKTMCEYNMPTLHVFENLDVPVVVISTTPGVLIRPIRMKIKDQKPVMQGPMVDSMCVYHSQTMKYINKKFPRYDVEVDQFASAVSQLFPFYMHGTEPRPSLGIQMSMQGLGSSVVKGDATMVSIGTKEPLIKTELLDMITSRNTSDHRIELAARPVVMAFINHTMNTEDAFCVTKEFAESGAFSWSALIDYPLPNNCGWIEPGMVLDKEEWWRPATKGLVMKIYMNKSGGTTATVQIYRETLDIGDKIGTYFGTKFTNGKLIPYMDMVELMDETTGDVFKPNITISTKNLNRGLGALCREMSYQTALFDTVSDFRSMKKPKNKTVVSYEDQITQSSETKQAYILIDGKKFTFVDEDGHERTLMCNYGIANIMHLRHMPVLKQHYQSTPVRSLTVKKGKNRGGTARLGETEILSILMQGGATTVSEQIETADKSDITKCSVCEAIPLFCDCPRPKPPPTTVSTRYAVVQLNTYATVAMLNDGKGAPMTMRYLTDA